MFISQTVVEQEIANSLFLHHGAILVNGKVDGISIGIEVNEMRSGSDRMYGYWKTGTGKYQVRVGTAFYGDIRSVGYKQLKDGQFSYDKIAGRMMEMRGEVQRNNDAAKLRRKREIDNYQLLEELGLSKWSGPLSVNDKTGQMSFKIHRLSEAHARQFMALSISLGLVTPEKK